MPKGKRKNNGIVHTVRGHAQCSGAIANTNAGGLFQLTKYQVDTTLCTVWTTLGQTFAKWRIRKLKFTYIPIKGSTTEGVLGILYLPDPNSTAPTTIATCLTAQDSVMDSIWHKMSLDVKTLIREWLFTRDGVATTDDRLELFGNAYVFSESTTASYVPGYLMMSFEIDWMDMANATVLPSPVPSSQEMIPKDIVELAQKLLKMKDKSKSDSNG